MASKDHPGCTWCGNCGKWKADKAFVRSRFKRGTQRWERCGFVWKKYKACNRCSRLYYHKPEMSVAEFVEQYGAEEHNDSEPDIDDDDDDDDDDETEDEGGHEGGNGAARQRMKAAMRVAMGRRVLLLWQPENFLLFFFEQNTTSAEERGAKCFLVLVGHEKPRGF